MDILQKLLQIEDETGGDVSNLKRLINSGQLTPASSIPQPDPKESVKEIELFNRFNRDYPNYADGGMLVQPSADGSRPGYAKDDKAASLANDYKKIVNYALNNRKIKNFNEPVEVIVKGKKTKINYVPTVVEWAKMNGVDRSIFQTKEGNIIPIKREQVYKKIVDDTIKLNNQTFTFSVPADIAMDIGITKNQGRSSGVEDLLKKGNVTKLLSKEELLSNYIKYLIDNDAPLKDLTNESIFKHINSRRVDKIKLTPDRNKQTTFADSKRTIGFNNISKIMKEQYPDLFAKIGRGGEIPFLSRTIQNKSNLGNLRLSEAFQKTESGDIYFNLIKSQNLNVRKQIAGLVSETDILQGKLKLDQKSLAISNAQDKMIKDLNKYVLNKPEVILNNPSFRQLASMRFENGKFIVDDNPEVINERLQRYINNGFFSTDHKVSKRTGKLNIEFPTNKQIVPTFINGPIKSMEDYITNNISKYSSDANIKTNIDNIVKVATNNNFTVNVPKGYSSIFGTNRTNIGAVGDIATISADGSVLKSYDDQLKKFNLNIDNIPELSNTKVIDYTSVDKSKIAQTLDTKMKTLESLRVSNLNQPQLEKVLKEGSPLHKKLMKFCPKSNGGEAGVCTLQEAMDGLVSESKQLRSGNMNDAQAKKTAQKIRAVTRVGTGSTLVSLLGPYGLAGEVVIDGAFMANNMLDGGDTYKEALSKSLIKYVMPTDARKKLEEETDPNTMILGTDTKGLAADYVDALEKDADLKQKYQNFLKVNKEGVGSLEDPYSSGTTPLFSPAEINKARRELMQAMMRASPTYGKNIYDIMKFGSPERQAFETKQEVFDAEKMQRKMDYDRKILGPLKDLSDTGFYSDEQLKRLDRAADRESLEIGQSQYGMPPSQSSGLQRFGDVAQLGVANLAKGGRAGFSSGTGGYNKPSHRQYLKQMETDLHKHFKRYKRIYGGKMKFNQFAPKFIKEYADGGIAGLSGGDKSGPPPERGPNSQGLPGLLKRVKKI